MTSGPNSGFASRLATVSTRSMPATAGVAIRRRRSSVVCVCHAQGVGRQGCGIGGAAGVCRVGSQHSGNPLRWRNRVRIQRARSRIPSQVDGPRAEGIAATVAQPRQRSRLDFVANADWVDQVAGGQVRCVLNHLVAVVVADALAWTRRRKAPAFPAEQRIVHVHGCLNDVGSFMRGSALGEPLFRQAVEYLSEALDRYVGQPSVQRCPTLDLVIPDVDAKAARHVLGVQLRRTAIVEVCLEVVSAARVAAGCPAPVAWRPL